MAEDDRQRKVGRGMKGARMPAEQRENIRKGVERWYRNLTPEAHSALLGRRRDAAICTVYRPRAKVLRPFKKGNTLGSANSLPRVTAQKQLAVSIRRVMRELVEREPHLIEEALRRGLQADPPKSYPFVALAAAYIDGRPPEHINIEATVHTQTSVQLSRLSDVDLLHLRELQLKMLGQGEPTEGA